MNEHGKWSIILINHRFLVLIIHPFRRYDRHKDQILRGTQSDYEDASLDVFQYFTASCYKGFGDDDGGFYKVYGDIFHQIATEDLEFMDDEEEFDRIPKFGNSTSDYEKIVGPFYGFWQSYSTKKSYSWLCPHNINEIRDRRILREIEKETRKLAQKARKDRNEEVRALVSFVRKRDKRVQQYKILLEEKAEQNRIKQNQKRLEQIKKNRLEMETMSKSTVLNVDGYEEMLRQMEKTYASSDDDDYDDDDGNDNSDMGEIIDRAEDLEVNCESDDDEEEYIDHLYCVACNKSFKNESSFKNHETSKKHLSNIERLKREMLDEDAGFKENESLDENHDSNDSEDVQRVEPVKKSKKSKKKNRVIVQSEPEQESEEIESVTQPESVEEKTEVVEKPRKSAKAKRLKKTEQSNSAVTTADSKPLDIDTSHVCVTCKSTFDSKNKLFAHLKKTNHGVYLPKETAPAATTNTKKGKRK